MKNALLVSCIIFLCACGGSSTRQKEEKTIPVAAVTATSAVLPVDSQVVFCLSMMANIPAAAFVPFKYDSSNAVKKIVNYAYPKMDATLANAGSLGVAGLANWQRAWGPAVETKFSDILAMSHVSLPPQVAAASLTVFKENTGNNYVVAIEATNPYSNYDWVMLDLDVTHTQPWSSFYAAPNSGNISQGTYTGLRSLLALQSTLDAQPMVIDYLKTIIANATVTNNIVVTGHSLGGALSPVFALYLQHIVDSMNGSATNKVYCMSTAGATPGDTAFASYYNGILGNTTAKISNYYDIIPRAWDTMLMNQITTLAPGGLYSGSAPCTPFDSIYICPCAKKQTAKYTAPFVPMATPPSITGLVNRAIDSAMASGVIYGHICNRGTYFMGPGVNGAAYLNTDTTGVSLVADLITGLVPADDAFLAEMGAQHVAAYALHFNIKGVHEYMKNMIDTSPVSVVNWACSGSMPSSAPVQKLPPAATPRQLSQNEAIWRKMYMYAWAW